MVRLAVTALLSLTLVAGCGGGGGPEGVDPQEWTADVCGSLEQWQSGLEEKAQTLTSEVLGLTRAEEAKKRIGAFLTDVIADTDRMLDSVEEAGVPAVEDGEAIVDEVVLALRQVGTAFREARDEVAALPTDDPANFQEALIGIGRELQTRGETIEGTLRRIELFDEAPACAELQG